MADIEIAPLSDRLSDDEIAELAKQMEKVGAGQLPRSDESHAGPVVEGLDDDAVDELLDRLEAHDLAAEIYLPVEFEGTVEVGNVRVASATLLLEILDEVKDELLEAEEDEDEDEEEDDDDDEDEDARSLAADLRQAWKGFHDGASASVERKLPLLIRI
jgi:hypothetical protein